MAAVIDENPVRGFRELLLLAAAGGAIFCVIALASFNSLDPGWSHSPSEQQVHNACGLIGAWLADFMLSFFGLTAYFLPIMLFCLGMIIYMPYSAGRRWQRLFGCVCGFVFSIVSGSAMFFLHLYFLRNKIDLPDSTGGIVGRELGDVLVKMLGNSGANLLTLGVFMTGITLLTGLSWLGLMSRIGWAVLILFGAGERPRRVYTEAEEDEPTADLVVRSSARQAESYKKPFENLADDQPPVPRPARKLVVNLPDAAAEAEAKNPARNAGKSEAAAIAYPNALPALDLLEQREIKTRRYSLPELEAISRQVESVLLDYGVSAEVEEVHPGPVITRFELRLAAGVKVSRISGLAKDLARGLSVTSVRIVEIIEGKSLIGLEIPNQEREMVSLRDLMASDAFLHAKSKLSLALGKDISGKPVVADLAKMPHALVAGTTGSGKSVAINAMILSLLYKSRPEEVRLIMIDPKMLELSVYEGIPHLLAPVVTDMKDAQNALRWAVAEMERRYKLMSKAGVRNLAGFNHAVREAEANGKPLRDPMYQPDPFGPGEPPLLSPLPHIVIIVDELADMMMTVGKKVEELIARLAQKARAAGIHLILATQRPSVDVLTGLIKANIPTRISFQVSSRIDSRTILDQGGAETLLGNGDMLFLPSGTSLPQRAHGAFVDDHEVHRVVEFLKLTGPVNYLTEITQERAENGELAAEAGGENDALYDEAVQFVTESRRASISGVQRRFKIGYNRAARIIEEMESAGVVSPPESNGGREVLAPPPPK